MTEYIVLPDRQLSRLKVHYTVLKPTLVIQLWRDSGVTLLTDQERVGRSAEDNHRIISWVGLILIFTANPLSSDWLQILTVLLTTVLMYNTHFLATVVVPDVNQ